MNPPDFAKVVRRHWKETTGYLVAAREPCIKIARDEARHVDRRFVRVDLVDVADQRPSGSWFMAVIVCPGDDLEGLAAWAQAHDPKRIHLYLHKDAKARLLAPWRDAGLPLHNVDMGIASWASLHKLLGNDLNVQVYDDHADTIA